MLYSNTYLVCAENNYCSNIICLRVCVCAHRSRTVKAVTDCFLIFLNPQDVSAIADEYPELQARLNSFRRLGERKARDYDKAWAMLHSSTAELYRSFHPSSAAKSSAEQEQEHQHEGEGEGEGEIRLQDASVRYQQQVAVRSLAERVESMEAVATARFNSLERLLKGVRRSKLAAAKQAKRNATPPRTPRENAGTDDATLSRPPPRLDDGGDVGAGAAAGAAAHVARRSTDGGRGSSSSSSRSRAPRDGTPPRRSPSS